VGAHIAVDGGEVAIGLDGGGGARVAFDPAVLGFWAARYDRAVRRDDAGALLDIGTEIFSWLDASGGASAWLREEGDRALDVDACGTPGGALARVPWEILARAGEFLALDGSRPLIVIRSVGRGSGDTPIAPLHSDLAMMFMSAAPEDAPPLAFELEESAILEATASSRLALVVEESGCAAFLAERMEADGPFDALHLSCHGTFDATGAPVLLLETPEGETARTTAAALAAALGPRPAPLVFVSACHSSAAGDGDSKAAEPLALALVRAGIANVVGWDGAVYDRDATVFAETFYRELSARAAVPRAVAAARRALLAAHRIDPARGRHWHLARSYAGPGGAGALCSEEATSRALRPTAGYKEFLDGANRRVPVAARAEFVGRRREAQMALRALRDPNVAGVLVHGMANLGKSSLAARLANRLPSLATALVFGRYDALAVLEPVLHALAPSENEATAVDARAAVTASPRALGDVLERLLLGPLAERPILLVIDDLERVLEEPSQGAGALAVRDGEPPGAARDALAGVLRAFARARRAGARSALLVTSRYLFTLPDAAGDLAAWLVPVPLRAMEARDRWKQWRAAARTTHVDAQSTALAPRLVDAAAGNPGLQEILCRSLLAGERQLAVEAAAAIDGFKATGRKPRPDGPWQEFFDRVPFDVYDRALTGAQRAQLRAAALFSEGLVVPMAAIEAAGKAQGVADPARAIARLHVLGLIDGVAGGALDADEAALNPLARALAQPPLDDGEREKLARAAFAALADAWRDAHGELPADARGVEAARLALEGGAQGAALDAAVRAGATALFTGSGDALGALRFLRPALARLDQPAPSTLRLAADCAERSGEADLQREVIERCLTLDDDDLGRARTRDRWAHLLLSRGEVDRALGVWRDETVPLFERLGRERECAESWGKIATVVGMRGSIDEELRIRRDEQVPRFERAGDLSGRARAFSAIADRLGDRGHPEEALRIHREEELPVYAMRGDVRARAVALGKIAEILRALGAVDESLRISRDECAPVFALLGDVEHRALAMCRVADILAQRGEIEEALRIQRTEVLAAYERLGDVRASAIARTRVADLLRARADLDAAALRQTGGDLDEALRMHREGLSLFERLGDIRWCAVTLLKIAEIRKARGELDEALRIWRDDVLPVYERLGDVRWRAVTLGLIADVLDAQGKVDEALRIRQDELLPAYEQVGDVRSRAFVMGRIAASLKERGRLDDALRLLREECLPVLAAAGDEREIAITMGRIADLLCERGNTEEALRIWREDELPVHERLGDARRSRLAMDKIARFTRTTKGGHRG
jgi:tetratricopeptide (TPR) repeat protein